MTAPRQVLRGTTYLVTRRCSERRYFLKPSRLTNQLFTYLLAVAAQESGVRVHAACVLSNHYHLVVTDPKAQLPRFVQFLNAFLARALNKEYGRRDHFWAPNSYNAVTLERPEDVVEKMAYTLANPVAGGLVRSAHKWPGVWTAPKAIGGPAIVVERPEGFFDRFGGMPDKAKLKLTVPPGFSSAQGLRSRLAEALERMVRAARAELKNAFLGVEKVLRQRHTGSPSTEEEPRGIRPRVAAKDTEARTAALERLEGFLAAYRDAWRRWRNGSRRVHFPEGTYWMRVTHQAPCASG